jgi:hypothetical protein
MLTRARLGALIAVVGTAALIPLYGDPRNSALTHAEWARMMLYGLGMEEAAKQTPTAAQAFAILSWKSSLSFRADRYASGDAVRVEGEGEKRQVVATGDVGEVTYTVGVVRGGDYRFRVHVAGSPETPVSAELARVGEVTPLGAFTVHPVQAMTWVDAGTTHLDPGAYTASVLLPRGASLETVEVAPPCVNPVEPPGGWKATSVLNTEDAAVTIVEAIDKQSELPPADTPLEFDASQFQTEWSATPVAAGGNGHAGSGLDGGKGGRRAIVMVDLPDTGLYTISAFGLTGAGQSWTADACMKSVLCATRDPRSDVAAWRPVLTSQFNSGRHTFSVLLAPGALIERVRAERKKETPADYAATLRRLGFDVGAPGPMSRDHAIEAIKFLDHKTAPLKETVCGDIVVPQTPPASRGSQVATGPGGGPGGNPGTGEPGLGGGGGPALPPTLPPQDVTTPVQPLPTPRP